MIKKALLFVIASAFLIVLGTFLYSRAYQNLTAHNLEQIPELVVPDKSDRVIVLAPHPDDEVLGAGGLISQSINSGAEVVVVFLTSGDGHRLSLLKDSHKIYPKSGDYINSGLQRQEEAKKALNVLGVKPENIVFLGYPDLGLKLLLGKNYTTVYRSPFTKETSSPYADSFSPGTIYTGENLQKDLVSIFEKYNPTMVVTSSSQDMHPDHAATGIFTKNAVREYGNKNLKFYSYLVHFRHFPDPKGLHDNRLLLPPKKISSKNLEKLSLNTNTVAVKEKALAEYKSQLGLPMLGGLMRGFVRQNELFYREY